MQPKLSVYAVFLLVCAFSVSGDCLRAQPVTLDTIVKQSLSTLILYLQTKTDRQATGDQSPYFPQGPINPALKELGYPREIFLSDPVAAQGLLNFNGHVNHQNGSSEWSLGTLHGRIVTYAFTISSVRAPPIAVTPSEPFTTLGHQSPVIKRPSFNITEDVIDLPTTFGSGPVEVNPAASPPPEPPRAPFVAVRPSPPIVDSRVVEFLFASTRQITVQSSASNIAYSGERGSLTFGAASVRIPDTHLIGRIELPSSWRLFGMTLVSKPNESAHFVIKRVVPLSEDAFGQVIQAKGTDTALVFVHGFNTTFEDALYRNAQIIYDLQYSGLSVLFTWPSRGDKMDYLYDRESAYLARDAFIAILQKLKRDYGIQQVNVLAHSMGNLIALDALANYSRATNPIQIARLIMAAPDVDRDQFEALAPAAKAIVGGMTLYASSADRAMALSRWLAGGVPRAGDVPVSGPIILPNLETIDVTAVGDDITGINHNVFAASREVMEDISALLKADRPPPRLAQIRPVPEPPSPPRFWRFVR